MYDRDFKRDAYHTLGVQEVWLVDSDDRSIEVSHRSGERVVKDAILWRVPVLEVDVRVDVLELFAGLELSS